MFNNGRPYYHHQHLSVDSNNGSFGNNTSAKNNDESASDQQQQLQQQSHRQRYVDPSAHDLNVKTGAALLTADCMGTGILALPGDMKILGSLFGLSFLVVNLFINFYAGSILCQSATFVEDLCPTTLNDDDDDDDDDDVTLNQLNTLVGVYQSTDTDTDILQSNAADKRQEYRTVHHHRQHNTSTTNDFISMTRALFDSHSAVTNIVTTVYYMNIFLVLGNYVLVMSHAVKAMLGDVICLPTAGIIASILMFGVSQLRTMARLGRSASAISLVALAILVAQCLVPLLFYPNSIHSSSSSQVETSSIQQRLYDRFLMVPTTSTSTTQWIFTYTIPFTILRQFAAASSIGFAVGSQKLLLNIRHEFKDRADTPHSLAIALTCFGTVYCLVCILAGTDVPSFLFDVIPRGSWSRRIAGFLLWIHVSVSFAINSQALCSSIDRVWFHQVTLFSLHSRHALRWVLLSLLLSISSYLVANAIPFFGDLVSFIGALTSVPLTLLLPAIFHRKVMGFPIFCIQSIRNKSDVQSLYLVLFSILFLICGVIGSLASIQKDWAKHGPPFSCQ